MQASAIPVKDSPTTPRTPDSPLDITKSARISLGKKTLAAQKASLCTTDLTGIWRKKANHGPHRDVIAFKPASFAEPKVFLTKLASDLSHKVVRRYTPLFPFKEVAG